MFIERSDKGFPQARPQPHRFGVRGRGVLVVDDLPVIQALLRYGLERQGFTVWVAGSGGEAVSVYREHRGAIDLVLLDVEMPGMDGPEALAGIQAIDPFVLACFMTAGTGAYTRDQLLGQGAACVIRKPFRVQEVADLIGRLVSGAPHEREAARQAACCWWN